MLADDVLTFIEQREAEQIILNDVRRVRVKVALDDIPSTPTYRLQQLQMMTEITKSLPPNLQRPPSPPRTPQASPPRRTSS